MSSRSAVEYVLDVIADDYESFETIVTEVNRLANERGQYFSEQQICESLSAVMAKGLAKSYELSFTDPQIKEVPFTRENVGGLSYFLSDKGRQYIQQHVDR